MDAKSKLVISDYASTAANVHDSKVFEQIVDEQDEVVFADSAYLSESKSLLMIYRSNDLKALLDANDR